MMKPIKVILKQCLYSKNDRTCPIAGKRILLCFYIKFLYFMFLYAYLYFLVCISNNAGFIQPILISALEVNILLPESLPLHNCDTTAHFVQNVQKTIEKTVVSISPNHKMSVSLQNNIECKNNASQCFTKHDNIIIIINKLV